MASCLVICLTLSVVFNWTESVFSKTKQKITWNCSVLAAMKQMRSVVKNVLIFKKSWQLTWLAKKQPGLSFTVGFTVSCSGAVSSCGYSTCGKSPLYFFLDIVVCLKTDMLSALWFCLWLCVSVCDSRQVLGVRVRVGAFICRPRFLLLCFLSGSFPKCFGFSRVI